MSTPVPFQRLPPIPDEWAVRWSVRPDAAIRLFCLPHTGAGAAVYRDWAFQMPEQVELIAIRLPGRETRFRQSPYARLDDLVVDLVAALTPLLDRPHAWFGHSMGALIAFESCRQLSSGANRPAALLVSGRPAPDIAPRLTPVHNEPAAGIVARLRDLGGTHDDLFADPHSLAALLPLLRADFAVSETYRYRTGPVLDVPIIVLGGEGDALTTADELAAWSAHTTAACTVRTFPGDHFFLHQDGSTVVTEILRHLNAVMTVRRSR